MEKKDLRIVFMGTPEFAVESLKSLVEGGYNVVAVVTQPDKPVGRHQDTLQPSQVKQYALSKGLPVLQPVKMKDPEFVEQLRSYQADLQVVVAFRMLPEVVWDMPRFGTFNVHAALLPQYRGAAPINWAVINGETETGVTTFFLDHDIDTGRIIMQKPFAIPDDADVEYVYDGLMHLGAEIAVETIDRLIASDGNIDSMPQDEMITTDTVLHSAPKIFKDTCRIDFNQPAKKVYDFIRGLSPYPGAWTEIQKEGSKAQVLKVFKTSKTGKAVVASSENAASSVVGTLRVEGKSLQIACADEWLQLDTIQISGKKRMEARDFLNGMRDIEQYRSI
ncbi:methionyl-tRNA formyltransferase [Segatella hominis]|uniref:Methionyl-tRNA formyltransferase n=1 Tax=Segatella hominis TaxID=2518605 RepID=A0A4Y8VV18_9BACT|nr:methionyl-tRNA formyltransferase [Segatella hominis]TFH84459.1 methionyl-tRNA formyltransferase [Segatella hominis]